MGGRYVVVYYRDGRRHRRSLGTSDRGEAERLAPAIFGELTRPRGSTVAALWAAYVAEMDGRAVLRAMIWTWKALAPRFGPLDATTITREDCRAHVAERRTRGIKDGTIHTELGHLRMVLLWARRAGMIREAPDIERPAKPPPRDRYLTREEARSLITACRAPHIQLFVLLALTTGARTAAILGLTWDRVDFERSKIDLRDPDITRPHKGRAIVPMNRTIRAALRDARQGALTDYVIEYGGGPVLAVKKGVAAAARRAGIPGVSPHVLRHTAGVHMAEAGVPMEEIAQYLGHRDVEVTRRIYARFSPHYLLGAASALEYDDLADPRRTGGKVVPGSTTSAAG